MRRMLKDLVVNYKDNIQATKANGERKWWQISKCYKQIHVSVNKLQQFFAEVLWVIF